jgi:hypothetical protein
MIPTNYAELQTEVADYVDRADLAPKIPGFIALAELRIRRDLTVRDMEKRVCLDTISGIQYYGLPQRYKAMRHIHLQTSPIQTLEYLTPQNFFIKWLGTNTGQPAVFTISGDEIAFGPTPDGVYTVEMFMYQRYAPLSDSNPVNWLITDAVDLLLYACNLEASLFIKDKEEIDKWAPLFDVAYKAVKKEDQLDRHSGGALMVVPDSPRF